MDCNTSIEERMDLERVSETELSNVLYVLSITIKTISEEEKLDCNCPNCKKEYENKDKIVKLRKYKQKLGLMHPDEEKEFDRALKIKETNKTMVKHLQAFYAKMAPHLSNERRLEIESDLDF